jgi:two-component system LytT family response regulator
MENKYRAILIDDEENALSILEIKIRKFFPSIEIIGKFNDPVEAIVQINQNKTDLLFLDIKMPGYNGFELLDHILIPDFELIFVTAYGEFALDAIKKCAIGYILKPIDENDLRLAILNAINHLSAKHKSSGIPMGSKITIPFNEGYLVKDISKIVRCEGFGGYTKIHMDNKEIVTSSYSIGMFNKLLYGNGFVMVHKSHLINKAYVTVYFNEGTIELANGERIPVSKSNRPLLLNLLRE